VPEEWLDIIIDAGIQAPSAGNQQLYTILDIRDQEIKEQLAVLCDKQPFIAQAPVVLVALADTRRWLDCYRLAGVEARAPGLGDLLLAWTDAVIAAQNMVAAAESLGLCSCYIGDILENKEAVSSLLHLDPLTVPAAMLVMGFPAESQRQKPPRPDRKYIRLYDHYRPLSGEELRSMFDQKHRGEGGFEQFMAAFCKRKYMSAFAAEMNRSAAEYLNQFAAW
jgi:nitroreductase